MFIVFYERRFTVEQVMSMTIRARVLDSAGPVQPVSKWHSTCALRLKVKANTSITIIVTVICCQTMHLGNKSDSETPGLCLFPSGQESVFLNVPVG